MAYNNFPMYYPQYSQQQMVGAQMSSPQTQQMQIQNGGFIPVRSEEEARNYPVAPGMSVTFIDESRQKVYAKTMGFSQLDRPIFDKYRLVKEEPVEPQIDTGIDKPIDKPSYVEKAEFEALRKRFDDLLLEFDEIKKKNVPISKKKSEEER